MAKKIKKSLLTVLLGLSICMAVASYGDNIDSGTLEYDDVYVYVNGSVTFMNGILWWPDKIWASVRMYGSDVDDIVFDYGTTYNASKNGTSYMSGTLYTAHLTDSISEVSCGTSGNSATLSLYNKYDKESLVLTATD
jgi:hypothetical protein